MSFCQSSGGGGAPAAAAPSIPVTPAASPAAAPSVPQAGTPPAQGMSAPNKLSFSDLVKAQIPTGAQYFMGSLGVKGFPSLKDFSSGSNETPIGNKPTDVTGMANPQIMAAMPKMQDPGAQKSSQGGGRLNSL